MNMHFDATLFVALNVRVLFNGYEESKYQKITEIRQLKENRVNDQLSS